VFGASITPAAQICQEIGLIYNSKQTVDLEGFRDVGLKSLATLSTRHTFREAIVALIDGAAKGEHLNETHPEKSDFGHVEIRVYRPHPYATIKFGGVAAARDRAHGVMYSARHPKDSHVEDYWEKDHPKHLGQERYIDYSCIEQIANAVQIHGA
jgi:hypothetical protein